MNSEPPSTWMALTVKGMSARSLSRKVGGETWRWRGLRRLGDGPFGDRIVGGEVLDRLVRARC